jgi:uncharacterized protein DUF2795
MEEKETLGSARHVPTHDAENINRAVEKAANDPDFINFAVSQLEGLRFPAFKANILSYARSINADQDVISLLQSLNGYMEFRDEYHVLKSLQENSAAKKKEYQLTDKTRESPDVQTRPTTADRGTKKREAVNENEERKDYPEVTPTAMSNFVCDRCGKPFQSPQDLTQHRQYESGTAVT